MTAVNHETELSATAHPIIAQRVPDEMRSDDAMLDLPAAARELHLPDRSGVRARVGLTLAVLAVVSSALVGSAVAITAYATGQDAPVVDRSSRAVGLATGEVLAEDLRVGFGFPFPGAVGLPLTLTNTADVPLSYNVTVEAVTGLGQRIAADVAFVSSVAPGQASTVTVFDSLGADTRTELDNATFRVIEASSY